MINYLLDGGNLYIEGVDLGKNHNNTELLKKLGIKFLDDGNENEVESLLGKPTAFMEDIYFDYKGGANAHFKVDILSSDGASPLFHSEDGADRMFAYETDSYKAVSSSVVFGALKDGDSLSMKPYLMSEIVSYFLQEDSTNGIKPIHAQGNSHFVAYPNPFKDDVSIQFTLEEPEDVVVHIYALDGRIVKTLVNSTLSEGKHTLNWDGTANSGSKVPKGIYFIQLSIGNQLLHKKLIYSN